MPVLQRLEQLIQHESGWCLRANHACTRQHTRAYFASVSRLGDGVFWYVLMAVLVLVDGYHGLLATAHMAITAAIALLMYKGLKRWTKRPRPCAANPEIRAWVAPLDEFSFPSGHTLHAVSFSMVAIAYYPMLAWLLMPFAVSVAMSRVVLGLHYPSDVIAATGIGIGLSSASLWLAGNTAFI